MSLPHSRYADLSRAELATLVPELLLIGQLIDRSGMAWCIASFGREEMLQIAIEEWAGCSPIYTKRMQKALHYEGDDVITDSAFVLYGGLFSVLNVRTQSLFGGGALGVEVLGPAAAGLEGVNFTIGVRGRDLVLAVVNGTVQVSVAEANIR